ncbi:hypothetical protein BaRGS_00014700 [Batillaria attramentaria]|uniref:Uncharacterized protein n=1 Tax=Batillaria attramentaria TaxID=370345 RepID=A0ABD0L3P3_9CAEN
MRSSRVEQLVRYVNPVPGTSCGTAHFPSCSLPSVYVVRRRCTSSTVDDVVSPTLPAGQRMAVSQSADLLISLLGRGGTAD